MEIELSEGKPHKEDKKEKLVQKLKWVVGDSDRLVDALYELAATKGLGEDDKSELIDIIVAAKGASEALKDILARHSDLDAETRKKIDEKTDEFVKGLLGNEEEVDTTDSKEG